jgi:hypothetical protein
MLVQCSTVNSYERQQPSKVYLAAMLGVMGILAWLAGNMMPAFVAKFFVFLAAALACAAGLASLWSP